LAFSQPSSEQRPSLRIRKIAGGRTIFAVSVMAYAKPGSWPIEDAALYSRYLSQMARVISQLIERDGFVVMVWSTIGDQKVIPEVLEHLDAGARKKLEQQLHIPEISSWKDLVDVLLEVDLLVASRLHSTILGYMALRPTVAISFDPKVDWLMEDLGQTDSLLQIRDFTAEDVVKALDNLESRKQSVTDQIRSYRQRAIPQFAMQYDAIAGLAEAFHPHHS
jgi:polysaccharide pyruvyl transferase WcaK-like protein